MFFFKNKNAKRLLFSTLPFLVFLSLTYLNYLRKESIAKHEKRKVIKIKIQLEKIKKETEEVKKSYNDIVQSYNDIVQSYNDIVQSCNYIQQELIHLKAWNDRKKDCEHIDNQTKEFEKDVINNLIKK